MKITMDPTGHYGSPLKTDAKARCVEDCGLLITYALAGNGTPATNMERNYPFSQGWQVPNVRATVDVVGVYWYPEDRPLWPVCKIEHGTETVYIYPHAIICVMEHGVFTKTTRMD